MRPCVDLAVADWQDFVIDEIKVVVTVAVAVAVAFSLVVLVDVAAGPTVPARVVVVDVVDDVDRIHAHLDIHHLREKWQNCASLASGSRLANRQMPQTSDASSCSRLTLRAMSVQGSSFDLKTFTTLWQQ